MPKVKISEYSATANSNTDVASINIDEGCAPSGINNAIRAVMGHLKDFQQGTNGDPFNGPVNGTLGATTASTAVVTTLNSTDATDASSTTAAAMKTAGGLGVAKKMFVGLDANIYGLTVGRGAGAVSTNTAVGASALPVNSAGARVTAIGASAGLTNTASDNTFLGYYSGATITSGTYNTYLGAQSGNGAASSTGSYNTGVGGLTFLSISSGSNNVATGYQALYYNTTASNNTAVGYQAGYSNTTGTPNTAVGAFALYYNTTGANNVTVGYHSLSSNTTGGSNVATGYQALYYNTTASNNTAVGYQAGYTNSTGTANTFTGYQAGYTSNATATNGYNTATGYQAGKALTTGIQNSFFGFGSGQLITSGGKNTIVGAYDGNTGGLDIRTASNYIVLSDGDGNPRGYFDESGQFWVKNSGATSVCFKGYATSASFAGILVDVFADRNTTNGSFNAYRYYNVTAGEVRFRVLDSGNVQNINNSYGGTSDLKLKENIVDASPKLEDLCKVKVRNYNFIGSDKKQIGVVAQELEEVFAGMVEETPDQDKDGNSLGTTTKSVKYSVFVPMLIKAIQELKAEVDSLKAQINGASA